MLHTTNNHLHQSIWCIYPIFCGYPYGLIYHEILGQPHNSSEFN